MGYQKKIQIKFNYPYFLSAVQYGQNPEEGKICIYVSYDTIKTIFCLANSIDLIKE